MTTSQTAPSSNRIRVIQGEHAVSDRPDVVLTTILGSCIAACIYDEEAKLGGMNHFLLPGACGQADLSTSFGVNAMELLINNLLQCGAQRHRLKAKLFGGGDVTADITADIGKMNADFAERFLIDENIEIIATSTGGTRARKVEYWPATGRARQAFLGEDRDLFARETAKPKQSSGDAGGDLELF